MKTANETIKEKVNKKINSETVKENLLQIYKFIELYKNFIDNIKNSINTNRINTNKIKIDVSNNVLEKK